MKFISKYKRKYTLKNGNIRIIFEVDNYYAKKELEAIKNEEEYILDIESKKDKRTQRQNRYLFLLINEIVKIDNGGRADSKDVWDLYLKLIAEANIKVDTITAIPEAEEILKKNYRRVDVMSTFEDNGKTFCVFRLYPGSSKFSRKEFIQLIEVVLDHASKFDLDLEFWKNVLR